MQAQRAKYIPSTFRIFWLQLHRTNLKSNRHLVPIGGLAPQPVLRVQRSLAALWLLHWQRNCQSLQRAVSGSASRDGQLAARVVTTLLLFLSLCVLKYWTDSQGVTFDLGPEVPLEATLPGSDFIHQRVYTRTHLTHLQNPLSATLLYVLRLPPNL